MEQVFGFHAVESLLKRSPERIQLLLLQDGRRDKRMNTLETLARNQGVALQRVPRKELDSRADGRHQGVVAEALPGDEHKELDDAGLMSLVRAAENPLV